MKPFNVTFGFLVAILLSACHPSKRDKQDVRDGMTLIMFAPPTMIMSVELYQKISQIDQGDRKSRFFKAGVDYQLMKTAYQQHKSIEMARLGDFNYPPAPIFVGHENLELKQRLSSLFATTSAALRQDLAEISMTPEAFGQVVGDNEVPKMLAMKPFPPDF